MPAAYLGRPRRHHGRRFPSFTVATVPLFPVAPRPIAILVPVACTRNGGPVAGHGMGPGAGPVPFSKSPDYTMRRPHTNSQRQIASSSFPNLATSTIKYPSSQTLNATGGYICPDYNYNTANIAKSQQLKANSQKHLRYGR